MCEHGASWLESTQNICAAAFWYQVKSYNENPSLGTFSSACGGVDYLITQLLLVELFVSPLGIHKTLSR